MAKSVIENLKSFNAYIRSIAKKRILLVFRLMNMESWLMKKLMCDMLNTFFSSVFCREEQEGILREVKNLFQEDTDSTLTNIEISEAIKSKLKILKPGKAPGMDGLVPAAA